MKNAIIKEDMILCPACQSAKNSVSRRFMTRNGWIENHARCETCGEEYSFFLDKYDKPIKERARIAAVLF